MKKIYSFIAIGLASFTISQAQNAVKNALPLSANGKEKANSKNLLPLKSIQNDGIAKAAPFWTDDFSVPAKWDISHAAGTSGDWVIGTAVPAGSFPLDPITSTTASNGYALFDSDLLCTNNQIADLTTASPINCSGHPSVLLKFQQTYRRFDDSTFVFVSTNGTIFTKFTVNGLIGNNNPQVNPETITLNIGSVAGNQPAVWIRFQFWSPSSYTSGPGGAPGCGYSWMIDDVTLEDAPANDLVLSTAIGFDLSQVPSNQNYASNFAGIVTNAGGFAQTNTKLNIKVNKNGSNVFDQNGTIYGSFGSGLTDTLFEPTNYTTNGVGSYTTVFTVSSDVTDNVPVDNILSQDFMVTDSVFARDAGFNANLTGQSNGTVTGTGESNPYSMGNYYSNSASGSVTATSITFAVVNSTAGLVNTVGETVRAVLYSIVPNSNPINAFEVAASSDHVITLAEVTDLSTATALNYITLPLDNPYTMNAGSEYFAVVEYLGNTSPKNVFIATSESNLFKAAGTSWLYDPTANTPGWFYFGAITPVVRLNVDFTVGVKDIESNQQKTTCYPNPTTGISTISYSITETADATVKITDVTGKLVGNYTQKNQPSGNHNFQVDLSNLPKGIYSYTLNAGNYVANERIVLR